MTDTKCSVCGGELVLLFYEVPGEEGTVTASAALICPKCDKIKVDPIDMSDDADD